MKRLLLISLISASLLAMEQDIDPIAMARSTTPQYNLNQVQQVVDKHAPIVDKHLAKPINAQVTAQDAEELAQAGVALAAARAYLQAPFTALTQTPQRSLQSEDREKYNTLLEFTRTRILDITKMKNPGYAKARSRVFVANMQGAWRNTTATTTCSVM